MREDSDGKLASALTEVARTLGTKRSVQETVQAIVLSSVATIPGAEYAGISLVRRRRTIETVAHSDEFVRRADLLQYEIGEGPCLDAAWNQDIYRVEDLSVEDRWPRFCPRAAELGVRSILAFRLYVIGDDMGALNLYSRRPGAFDEQSEQVGRLFAAQAAVALAGSQREQRLAEAIQTRDLIGQAKGMLMERHGISGEQAFLMLVETSQRANIKLRDVAEYLVNDREQRTSRSTTHG
jgi:GAF domain-containing protein